MCKLPHHNIRACFYADVAILQYPPNQRTREIQPRHDHEYVVKQIHWNDPSKKTGYNLALVATKRERFSEEFALPDYKEQTAIEYLLYWILRYPDNEELQTIFQRALTIVKRHPTLDRLLEYLNMESIHYTLEAGVPSSVKALLKYNTVEKRHVSNALKLSGVQMRVPLAEFFLLKMQGGINDDLKQSLCSNASFFPLLKHIPRKELHDEDVVRIQQTLQESGEEESVSLCLLYTSPSPRD